MKRSVCTRSVCRSFLRCCTITCVGILPFVMLSTSGSITTSTSNGGGNSGGADHGPPPRQVHSKNVRHAPIHHPARLLRGGSNFDSPSKRGQRETNGNSVQQKSSAEASGESLEEERAGFGSLSLNRVQAALQAYRRRLIEERHAIARAPWQLLEGLKERYERTGVSEVGWLQKDESGPVEMLEDDVTVLFMELLAVIDERRSILQQVRDPLARLERRLSEISAGIGDLALDSGTRDRRQKETDVDFTDRAGHEGPSGEDDGDGKARLDDLPYGVGGTDQLSEYCYLLVPGLLSQYSPPLYFTETLYRLRDQLKLDARIVSLDSEAGTITNALAIEEAVSRAHTETGKLCIILGHSKGGIDSAAALAMHPHLRPLVAGLIFVQTPYGGSPIASDMLVDEFLRAAVDWVASVLGTKADAPLDLTYAERRAFLKDHPLDPYDELFHKRALNRHINLDVAAAATTNLEGRAGSSAPNSTTTQPASTSTTGGTISATSSATLPAQRPRKVAKRPIFPMISFHSTIGESNFLSPFALTAAYMRRRYDEASDGMVAAGDAEVPGSSVVRFRNCDMDHLGPVYPSVSGLVEDKAGALLAVRKALPGVWTTTPSGADVCEALVRLLLLRFSFPKQPL